MPPMPLPGDHLPPPRDGVGPSQVVVPAGDWPTLLDFLVARFPEQGEALWRERLDTGAVMDAHGQPVTADQLCTPGLRLYYYRSLPTEVTVPFEEELLYQDEDLLVVDKPHFLPVVPSGGYLQQTLLVRLKRRLGLDALVPLHRIDRETAGLVMFSVRPSTREPYHALFRQRRITKVYEAVAPWQPGTVLPLTRHSRLERAAHFMQQHEVPGEANATTHVHLLRVLGPQATPALHALYALHPVTGHRHQLRVHMAALGMPIVDDRLYPRLLPAQAVPDFQQPLQLLARSLAFEDPLTGERRMFRSRRTLALAGPD